MSEQKVYVGGAKEINGNFGAFHKISFSHNDLNMLMEHLNEKGYVNLAMNRRREPSQYGQTHSLVIDTWQPQPQGQMPQPPQANNFQNPQAVNQFQQGQNQQFQPPINQPPQFQESPMQAFQNEQPMQANPQYQQPQQ